MLLRLEHGPRKSKGHLGLQMLLTLVRSLYTAVSNDAHCSENILRRCNLTIFHAMFWFETMIDNTDANLADSDA